MASLKGRMGGELHALALTTSAGVSAGASRVGRWLVCLCAFAALAPAAASEVRFGAHVHIGGHDVSNQTFDRHRRGAFYPHATQPHPSGCVWRQNADGSVTKICRYKQLH